MLYQKRTITFAHFLVTLSLSACSYNPLSTTNHLTGDPVETAVGGVAGFGVASALGVTSEPLLGLATIGGAGVGYYMSSLRYDAAGIYQAHGQVFTLGDYVTIEIPTNQIFDSNSADIIPSGDAALRSAAKVMNRFCCQNVLVSGNSSGFASAKFERKLTEERARAASAFLWAQGLNNFKRASNDTRTLTYVGYGNYFPIANNITNEGIRANSRIQITAYPSKDQLLIDEKKRTFGNMGGLDEPYLSQSDPQPQYADNAFNGLPENADIDSADMEG